MNYSTVGNEISIYTKKREKNDKIKILALSVINSIQLVIS